MTATDLDPLFVKALRLLNSKSKDSAAQLKAMLDEAIAQRKGLKVPAQGGDAGKMSPARSKGDDDYKRKEADKRSLEKGYKDSSEPDAKKSKLDSKHRTKDEKDAREKEREKEKARRERDKKEKEEKEAQRQKEKAEREKKEKAKQENEVTMISDDEEETTSQLDAVALEMDLACVVCKQFNLSSGNRFVECQECHSLYHQECHKPPVADETVSDPRFAWYCNRCQKMLQKKQQQAAQKPVAKPSKISAPLMPGKETNASISSPAKPFKTEAAAMPLGGASTGSSTSQAFRKPDPKVIVPPKDTNNQSKPILGLAGLAANLAKPQSKSSSSHRKSDQKGGDSSSKSSKVDGSKPASKTDGNSHSSKPKTEEKRPDKQYSSLSEKERKYESGSSKSTSGREEKKPSGAESISKSSSSSSTLERSEKKFTEPSSKSSEKKPSSSSEVSKSSTTSSSSGLRLDVPSSSVSSSSRNSPPSFLPSDPPDSLSVSSSKPAGVGGVASSSDKNKKAMATLSMITANKRMQMMMKKAQAKPSDKKVHIK